MGYNLLLIFCMLGSFSVCFAANNNTEINSTINNTITTEKNINTKTGERSGKSFEKNQNSFCICPKCGEKKSRQRGVPCRSTNCPKCNSAMIGEGNNRNMNMRKSRRNNFGNNQKSQFFCVCPVCGKKQPHQRGIPCNSTSCPKCDSMMRRE